MQDQEKTKEQLIDELNKMRSKVAEFETTRVKLLNTEKTSKELLSNYRQMTETASEAIFVIQDGLIKFENKACLAITGYDFGAWTSSSPIQDIIHPDDREMATEYHKRRVLGEKTPHRYELRIVCKDGNVKWVEMNASMIMWSGKPAGLGMITDITDRKLAESDLKSSEEKFSKAFQSSPDAIIISRTTDGRLLDVNEGFSLISGYSRDEALQSSTIALKLWANQQDRETVIAALQEKKSIRDYEFSFRIKSGKILNCLYSGEIILIGGKPHILSVVRDITERKQAEETLKEREQMLRTILSISPVGIGLTQDRVMKWVNEAWVRIFGFQDEGEPIGLDARHVYPSEKEYARVGRILYPKLETGVTTEVDASFQRKDGSVFDGHIRMRAINPSDPSQGTIASISDITERKQAEQERENLRAQLLQSQKMETMGTLATGIAHDFNNMLTIILGFSDMLLADKNKGDHGYEELQKIVKTSQDAADLVQKIRIFGTKAEMNLVPLDLNHQINQVTKILSSTLPKMIEMDIHLTKDPVIIRADSSQIAQMVMNLAVNANEAMPQGGRLSILTENIVMDDDYCRLHLGVKPGPHVLLTVSDTGRGIDKGLMERIFDPFYSTKMRDYHKGTGLGLSVVQGIVQQHGGHITVESEVGKGTFFRMYFPALEVEKVPEYVEKEIPYPAGGTETILLVEDMVLVRDLVVTILETFGYTVLSAGDGQEALEVYEKEQGNISLVILDIIMPRMDGKECLEQLLRINPAVKVIISSGVGQEDLINEVVKIGAKGAVNKPYGMRQLLGMVRQVLDGD